MNTSTSIAKYDHVEIGKTFWVVNLMDFPVQADVQSIERLTPSNLVMVRLRYTACDYEGVPRVHYLERPCDECYLLRSQCLRKLQSQFEGRAFWAQIEAEREEEAEKLEPNLIKP